MSNLYLLLVFVTCICYFIHTSEGNTDFAPHSSRDDFQNDKTRLINAINRLQRVKRSRGYPRFTNTGLYPYGGNIGSRYPVYGGLNGFTNGFPTNGLNSFNGFPLNGLNTLG
ncbi:uncharacterized protein LOC143235072 [Tachypleus tridentatus]|uniref:uncharacterized protein LOC143235072 n=1 Tax=Tachypleus tridentatus TaxID=6853 RepID=UPI003FD024BF